MPGTGGHSAREAHPADVAKRLRLDGVGEKASVGQAGGLERARPAVEVALAPERQQLRQV
jgi:hypothetical protein